MRIYLSLSRFRVIIDDLFNLIIVCSILVKFPKPKGLQGQLAFQQFNILLRYSSNHRCYRFPAHEHISGASKIPTVIYYDQSGKVRAVGAEAMEESVYVSAEEESWVKAEW